MLENLAKRCTNYNYRRKETGNLFKKNKIVILWTTLLSNEKQMFIQWYKNKEHQCIWEVAGKKGELKLSSF
jgi:hypothetical protein